MRFGITGIYLVLILSGCGDNSSNSKSSGTGFSTSFKDGDKALSLSFPEGASPNEIFDGGVRPFIVRVLVKNEGESHIEAEKDNLVLTGIDPDSFNLVNVSKPIPPLRGYKLQGDIRH